MTESTEPYAAHIAKRAGVCRCAGCGAALDGDKEHVCGPTYEELASTRDTLLKALADTREQAARRDPGYEAMETTEWGAVVDPQAVPDYVNAVFQRADHELEAALDSRARLVRLFHERGIDAISWRIADDSPPTITHIEGPG